MFHLVVGCATVTSGCKDDAMLWELTPKKTQACLWVLVAGAECRVPAAACWAASLLVPVRLKGRDVLFPSVTKYI